MDYANSKPQKACGGSSITRASREGTAVTNFLFYFKPDTNGSAYVIMTRAENYTAYSRWSITVPGASYDGANSGTDVDAYLHNVRITGLTTGKTYTIRLSWFKSDGSESYTEIKRTYYCSNVTPPEHPYSDIYGDTTVPSYSTSYPYYCLKIDCPDNASKLDSRCPYDESTRNLFWHVCATNYETHAIGSAMAPVGTTRWAPGTVYVSVTYMSTTNKSEISARIDEWISWMNGLVESAGVTFKLGSTTADNARQMTVIVGTHEQLWGYNPDTTTQETQLFGGTWETQYWGDGILEARVKICCESRYPFNYCTPAFQGIVFEELTEASGPGYDQFGLNNTIFSEISYPGKTLGGPPGEPWTRDENVIRILYSIGYLKGEKSDLYEYDSAYGSGIHFTNYYNSYGALSSSSPDLFFEINATEGVVTGYDGYTLPDTLPLIYKNQRAYKISAIYATEIPTTQKEQSSGLSFRYTNPSAEGSPSFSLPNNPEYSNIRRVNGGFKIDVSGLNTSGEYYRLEAHLKDMADQDVDDYYDFRRGSYSTKTLNMNTLKYGRRYEFYLYSTYNGIHSDWWSIGEGTVAPKTPTISAMSHTDTSVTFTYDMGDTAFDDVVYEIYRNGVKVASDKNSAAPKTVTLDFDSAGGNYTLKVYSVVRVNGATIQCVDSDGADTFASYEFSIENRAYFYWSDYTTEVKQGGTLSNISHTVWNAFVQNVYDTVCVFSLKAGNMPNNTTTYASGFGSAAGESYETALMTYAMMSDSTSGRTLTAERFNIVNYVISLAAATGVSYKYNKDTSPTEVDALDLLTLQDKLNSI